MTHLHIAKLQSRYRLAKGDEWHARVHDIQQSLLDTHLEAAVGALAVNEDEIVCIRRIYVPLTIGQYQTDYDAAWQWSEVIARELQRALLGDAGFEVVRFRHRLAALQQFALDVMREDQRRAWVWQKLAFIDTDFQQLSADERFAALITLLLKEHALIIPLLRYFSRSAMLAWFAQAVSKQQSSMLLQAAIKAVGSAVDISQLLAEIPHRDRALVKQLQADRLLASSTMEALRAVIRQTQVPMLQKHWAAMALLVTQPHVYRSDVAQLSNLITALWLAARRDEVDALELTPIDTQAATATDKPAMIVVSVDESPMSQAFEPPQTSPALDSLAERLNEAVSYEPADDVRQEQPGPAQGVSEFGGLLFLLPLVETSGALERLLGDDTFTGMDLDELLHRLALALYPLPADDPAALAFAGLMPDQTAPTEPHRELDESQQTVLNDAKTMIIDTVENRLPQWPRVSLLQRLIERHAVIMADPGWFEIHYRLNDVSVDLRRAALDLDPGFIPWLGVVIKYVYE